MAETGIVSGFKVMIIVMLFYAVSITMITYALEDTTATDQILPFTELADEVDLEGTSSQIEESLTQQTNIPVIEVGALVFFAKDFKIGMIVLMVTSGGLFIWFYEASLNYTLPLAVFFASLVILALSLYAVNKSSTTGGFT